MPWDTTEMTVAALAAAGLGLVVVWVAARGRRLAAWHVAAGAAAGAGILALATATRAGPLDSFGRLHVVYLAVVLTLPVVGAVSLLLAWALGGRRWAVALAGVLVVPGPVGWYATHVEPHWLRVDHVAVPVPAERQGDDEVRIAVLADLQTESVGDHERRAVDAVLAAEPHLVVLPGDLFQGTSVELADALPGLRGLLRRLEAPHGVYFVRGDTDGGGHAERILAGLDHITVLDDSAVDLAVGDRLVRLGGTRLDHTTPAAASVRDQLQSPPPGGAVTVLVSHRPDPVLALPAGSRVDLVVAGHTHGGQVVIPGYGPVITLTDVPRGVARGGLHTVDGNRIYVSPGVGVERGQAPQVRLFNRPAVAVLTLSG